MHEVKLMAKNYTKAQAMRACERMRTTIAKLYFSGYISGNDVTSLDRKFSSMKKKIKMN